MQDGKVPSTLDLDPTRKYFRYTGRCLRSLRFSVYAEGLAYLVEEVDNKIKLQGFWYNGEPYLCITLFSRQLPDWWEPISYEDVCLILLANV